MPTGTTKLLRGWRAAGPGWNRGRSGTTRKGMGLKEGPMEARKGAASVIEVLLLSPFLASIHQDGSHALISVPSLHREAGVVP